MLTTNALLDAAKRAHAIPSDYRLARTIHVTDNTLYNYRHGRTPDDERALKLAQMAGLHAGFVLVSMAAERAKDDPTRSVLSAAALTIAKAFPGQTVDILRLQSRTPDRLETPINKGFGTMGQGSDENIHRSKYVNGLPWHASPPMATAPSETHHSCLNPCEPGQLREHFQQSVLARSPISPCSFG